MNTLSKNFINGMLFTMASAIREGAPPEMMASILREAGVDAKEVEEKCDIVKHDFDCLKDVWRAAEFPEFRSKFLEKMKKNT